jgi:hypothetical protein
MIVAPSIDAPVNHGCMASIAASAIGVRPKANNSPGATT